MKKWFLIIAAAWLLVGCGLKEGPMPGPAAESETQETLVKLVIDTGIKAATYSAKLNEEATVLSLLKQVSQENEIELKLKEYDFGTMVESIGGKENSKERAWIYFLNGQTGDVGAGDKKLAAGDLVEWKYIEPIY